MSTQRERNTRAGRHTDRATHARHHLTGDAGQIAGLNLFPPPAIDEGIATLQTDDLLSGPGPLDQKIVDLILGQRVLTGRLKDIDQLCIGPREGQEFGADEPIIHDHIRPL